MAAKLLIAALLLAGLMLAVRVYLSRPQEDRLQAGEAVDIRALRDPLPGNAFLACPPDYCAATPGVASPVFDIPVGRLAQLWLAMMAETPRVAIVGDTPERQRLIVIQHTALLRFPDIVTVEFVALSAARSTLAIYSKSRYGRGDFGTNRRRVLAWLGQIEVRAAQ
ncbi:MAG TPA: DUF1499 domain-containing protein [Stellaceae bacterium]|jgi:hypothetical protein|nr:DUF1499 domain-containing protein [Stellaceae bacterium]